jgi:hypothetical protein
MMIPAGPDNKKAMQMHGLVIESVIYKCIRDSIFRLPDKKTYTGTKSKCNCLACMKPCGLFFCPKKKPTEMGLTAIIIFIRCGAGCLPVSRRQSTDDSQCAKTYQTGNALRIGGFTTQKFNI